MPLSAMGNLYLSMCALCNAAAVRVAQGRLRDALAVYQEALAFEAVSRAIPALGAAYVGIAGIAREQNNLAVAREHLARGRDLVQQGGIAPILRAGAIEELRMRLAEGEEAGVRTALRAAEQLAT